jgi:hypothetical protein
MMEKPEQPSLIFRKSSFSGGNGGGCLEVAELPEGGRAVRDSKQNGAGPVLWFNAAEWESFVQGVKAGEFDS